MRLLVSVRDALEARAALAGGADIIDAKDPASGPLGAVSLTGVRLIRRATTDATLLSAALGDADTERSVEYRARDYAQAGARLVKIGFAAVTDTGRVATLLRAAVRGAAVVHGRCGVVAVAYADAHCVGSVAPSALIEAAVHAGVAGVLLDTADKQGPGLRAQLSPTALRAWIACARDAGFLVAVAGKLEVDDLAFVRDAGADVAGVRGAACEGGRAGRVTTARVSGLVMRLGAIAVPGRATRRSRIRP